MMDEYIKREDAIKHLRGACIAKYPLSFSYGIFASADEISKLPTADVVPKSEVEKLKIEIEALKIANEKMYAAIEATKAEVANQIFEGLENILDAMIQLNHGIGINHADYLEQEKAIAATEALGAFRDYVAELKKKYQGGELNG